ncbi:unnamed protein product [Urochloa decumbens]|uniref:DUF6598 domain-containing protein n=1 Tax=Urochloa decumbens TaxID=240449 RepID=A0ABC9F581_9POAL
MPGASEGDLSAVQVQAAAASSEKEKLDYEAEARLVAEARASWDRKARGEEEDDEEDPETSLDYYAYEAKQFRNFWNCLYFGYFGTFEDTTKIPPMRFTDEPPEPWRAYPRPTLQVFSVRVGGLKGGLQWPLHVFGKVAARDSADRNRNMIFDRTRDNCQILTKEVPNLKLTGPSRAVLLIDPVTFEVDLKVKGCTESEDKHLSFLAVQFSDMITLDSCLRKSAYTSKLSTLWFTLGIVVFSVEATISVRVSGGSWPDGLRAQFAAHTASIGSQELILLDSGNDKLPVSGDGTITFGRRVASVEVDEELNVSVKAWQGGEVTVHTEMCFKAKKAGRSGGSLDVGFCQLDVSVAWSLLSSDGD